jgi:hypothetical protein
MNTGKIQDLVLSIFRSACAQCLRVERECRVCKSGFIRGKIVFRFITILIRIVSLSY